MDEYLSSVIRAAVRLFALSIAGLLLLALAAVVLKAALGQLGLVVMTPGGLLIAVLVWRYLGRRQKS